MYSRCQLKEKTKLRDLLPVKRGPAIAQKTEFAAGIREKEVLLFWG